MATKDPVLSVRLPEDLSDRLDKCAEKLDLSKNDIARHAIRAAVAAIEANGFKITVPLEMAVRPQSPFHSTVVSPVPSESVSSLNEETPTRPPAVPENEAPTRQTRPTKTRAIMREIALKQKPETSE